MAAGLGFKTFTTGEVLTAADTNGYLMQGVLVFASSAARASAVTSPQEGQYSYLKDTNSTEYYDGAAWIAAPIGDITGVTAGTGISGGGTSGTVTITNSMATEITAKADLIVGTGNAAFDNLAVGTNGQVLTADSTVSPTGLKWATVSNTAKGCSLYLTASQSTSTGVDSTVAWTNELYDTDVFHDTSTNNDRITIPTGLGGKYLVTVYISWSSNTTGYRQLVLKKNGSLFYYNNIPPTNGAGGTSMMSAVLNLSAADYLNFTVYQNSGTTLNITGAAIETFCQVSYLGA